MNRIKYYLKIYFMLFAQYLKSRMQYKADFLAGTVGLLMTNLSVMVSLWLIFHSIPALAGWSYYELMFFYGFFLLALTPQQIFFGSAWGLSNEVRSGNFIKFYFRPLNMMFYYMTSWFDLNGFGQFLLGLGITIYSATKIGVHWSFLKILLLLITLVSSSLTLIAIVVAGTSMCFWIVNSNSLTLVLATVRDFGRYPLTIFKGIFRILLTYLLPIGFIAFYPAQLLLRPVAEISVAAYFSPVVGFILFALAYALWKKGVKSYSGTGT